MGYSRYDESSGIVDGDQLNIWGRLLAPSPAKDAIARLLDPAPPATKPPKPTVPAPTVPIENPPTKYDPPVDPTISGPIIGHYGTYTGEVEALPVYKRPIVIYAVAGLVLLYVYRKF